MRTGRLHIAVVEVMKKIIIAFLLAMLFTVKAGASEDLFCAGVNLQLGAFAGMEHRYNEHIGFRGDIGLAIFGLVLFDALFLVYFLPDHYRWQVGLAAGIPNAGMPLSFNAGMVSAGGSVFTRFRANEKLNIDFRIGTGFPFFFEKDRNIIRDINTPLNLWPDLFLGVSFEW